MKRSHEGLELGSCRSSGYSDPDYDLLGSQELRKSHLVSSNGDLLPVEILRGKIVALYFLDLNKQYPLLQIWINNFYKIVMQKEHANFDMVFVAVPSSVIASDYSQFQDVVVDDDDKLSLLTKFTSTLPFPSVPFQDRDWRSYLCGMYLHRRNTYFRCMEEAINCIQVTIIDTSNKGHVLYQSALPCIVRYGPDGYPFTEDRLQEVRDQFDKFGRGCINSLQDLLGSDSRDYLIDPHSNKVPISELEAYGSVGFYAFTRSSVNVDPFREHLHKIYKKINFGGTKSFQIVFIDLMTDCSYSDEDKKMPWLTLPFGDEKTWILANMFTRDPTLGRDLGSFTSWEDGPEHPLLFIKPKGEAYLEMYGYDIIEHFGEDACPFTERALARHTIVKLQRWTLDSFVKQAGQVGLDLNRFVRHKIEKGEKEEVTLSSLMESSRGIILMFVALHADEAKKALDSLTEAYKKQDELPFEVIFACAYCKEIHSDVGHLSNIPWLTLEEEPDRQVFEDLTVETGKLLSFYMDSFITFAPDGTLLGAGLLETLENCNFPLISEDDLMKHVGVCLLLNHGWWAHDLDCFRWLGLPR